MACSALLILGTRFAINHTQNADRLVRPLLLEDTAGDADAIVVLGAGVVGRCVPNHNGVQRVLLGAQAWREKRASLMVFTGGSSGASCPVAVAMATLARQIGVPEASIRVETASQTTHENATQTAALLRQLGASRLLVVTDRLHMPRAAGAFARLGFAVERAAVPVYAGHRDNASMLLAAMREAVALFYYRARGWVAPVAQSDETRSWAPANRQAVTQNAGDGARSMEAGIRNPSGPVVILGASYAGGWAVKHVGARPIINKGAEGEQSFQLLARFDRDVTSENPRAVILWGFINDIFRAPHTDIETALIRVRTSFADMIRLAKQHGIEPILATEVTVRPPDSWAEMFASWLGALLGKEGYQQRINRHVLATNQWLRDLAKHERLLLLDLQPVLAEPGGDRRKEFVQPDGSHITGEGYAAVTDYALPILERHLRIVVERPGGLDSAEKP
jgi:uncharacterized SAM-binding protein YcdF (DUF218 family)/lysophospholipase L1-like esterase